MALDDLSGDAAPAAPGGINDPQPAGAAERGRARHAAQQANGGNNGDDDDAEQQLQQEEELPLIHSLEHYIRTRGIAPAEEQSQQNADVIYADSHHARKRQVADARYQESVHRAAFAEYDMKEQDEKMSRRRFLDTLNGQTIEVLSRKAEHVEEMEASFGMCTTNQCTATTATSFPLDVLASACDTVYTMVRSERTYWSRQNSALSDVDNVENNEHQSTLDLTNFESGPVESFLSLIAIKDENDDTNINDDDIISLESIPSHHIVDVCLISHYLQCSSVLGETIEVLKESVDSDNCLSICRLADQLGSPSLFEASVSHLIEILDCIQDHDEWEDFPITLRNRVVTMRNAVHSSIIGRGQKTSVFFSSSEEFLAIFSDNIREQRERLAEAKRRQEEIIQDRIQNPGGRHRDPYGGSVKDAEIKIERQEQRLQTLETFYKEQKLIFSGGAGGGLGSFSMNNKNKSDEKQPFRLGYS